MTMTDRGALGVVLALRANELVHLFLQELRQHAQPNTHADREQPLPRRTDKLPKRLPHALGQHSLLHRRPRDRHLALHGGSSA